MKVTSLREPKMADRVATVLRKMFIRGDIAVGTMLPPESELMEQFGVSRPTLREAFQVLESESLIEVQRGVRGGARVTSPTKQTLARYAGLILEFEGVTLKDVYDARAALEADMIRRLATDPRPETVAALEAALTPADADISDEQSRVALAEFHIAIAELCGTRPPQMVNEMLLPPDRPGHPVDAAHRQPGRTGVETVDEGTRPGGGTDQGRRRRRGRRLLALLTWSAPRRTR